MLRGSKKYHWRYWGPCGVSFWISFSYYSSTFIIKQLASAAFLDLLNAPEKLPRRNSKTSRSYCFLFRRQSFLSNRALKRNKLYSWGSWGQAHQGECRCKAPENFQCFNHKNIWNKPTVCLLVWFVSSSTSLRKIENLHESTQIPNKRLRQFLWTIIAKIQ